MQRTKICSPQKFRFLRVFYRLLLLFSNSIFPLVILQHFLENPFHDTGESPVSPSLFIPFHSSPRNPTIVNNPLQPDSPENTTENKLIAKYTMPNYNKYD